MNHGDSRTPSSPIDPRNSRLHPLPQASHQELNRIVFQFEDAWQNGQPDIAAFLPPDGPLRWHVLQELVRIDFEYRCTRGESPDPKEYLRRFPELNSSSDQVQSLMSWFSQFTPLPRASSMPGDGIVPLAYWASIKPGTALGNYTILELIGQGGMGAVFKARHRHMNRVVALKTISPQIVRSSEAVKRFRREVQAAACLDHPNIVTAHDADQFGDIHALVMQYIEGCDLASLVRQKGPLSISEAIDYLMQSARGLEYAHRNGIIHRDIKPANLILNHAGQLKILDMGLARIEEALRTDPDDLYELTMPGEVIGTVDFMSPEQASDPASVGAPADAYSLGCTLYFLLTGKGPFGGGTLTQRLLAHREAPIPRLQDARPDIPDWLEQLFQRLVAKKPSDRIQSMSELLTVLNETSVLRRKELPSAATRGPATLLGSLANQYRHLRIPAAVVAGLLVTVPAGYVIRQQFATSPPVKAASPNVHSPVNLLSPQAIPVTQQTHAAGPLSSFPMTLIPVLVSDVATDSRYSLLVNNGILLSPDNGLFDESERESISKYQAALAEPSGLTQFFVGRLELPADWSAGRIRNTSPEKCLTAWIALRDGQQPERLNVELDSNDVTIDSKGAGKITIFVIAFPPNEAAAEYLGTRGLSCKVLSTTK